MLLLSEGAHPTDYFYLYSTRTLEVFSGSFAFEGKDAEISDDPLHAAQATAGPAQ